MDPRPPRRLSPQKKAEILAQTRADRLPFVVASLERMAAACTYPDHKIGRPHLVAMRRDPGVGPWGLFVTYARKVSAEAWPPGLDPMTVGVETIFGDTFFEALHDFHYRCNEWMGSEFSPGLYPAADVSEMKGIIDGVAERMVAGWKAAADATDHDPRTWPKTPEGYQLGWERAIVKATGDIVLAMKASLRKPDRAEIHAGLLSIFEHAVAADPKSFDDWGPPESWPDGQPASFLWQVFRLAFNVALGADIAVTPEARRDFYAVVASCVDDWIETTTDTTDSPEGKRIIVENGS